MQSHGQAAVESRANQVEPGSLRHQVLLTAHKFKSSWVELGALLVKVRNEGAWEEWDYASFEEYCSKELHLKRQTALKLTNSYSFLARHEKNLLEDHHHAERGERSGRTGTVPRQAPAFEVVSVLAGAQERGQLSDQEYKKLRDSIWDDERPAHELARELTARFPSPPKPNPPVDLVLRRLSQAARKLATDLGACDKVPQAVAQRAEALAEDVAELVQSASK